MEPFVSRAFLNKLLNDAEKKDLVAFEKSLPQGRYLQGFEVCRRYNLKPKPIPDSDIQRMNTLLWKWEQAWEVKYEKLRELASEGTFDVNDDHLLGDLWDWEKFAEENYQETLPQYPSMVCLAVLLLPLMFK